MVIKKSLYQISKQYNVAYATLRQRAEKLFGRTTGDFSKEEAEQLLQRSLRGGNLQNENHHTNSCYVGIDVTPSKHNKNMYGGFEKITIHDYRIRKIDAYISTLFPQWLHEPDRLSKIAGMLNRAQKKAIQVYTDMLKETEYIDDYVQLMGDEDESESDDF